MTLADKENAMNRMAKGLVAAALASVVLASGSAWAQLGYPNYPYDAAYSPRTWGFYGYPWQYTYTYYPYGYSYDYSTPLGVIDALATPFAAAAAAPAVVVTGAPLVAGRSVATSSVGDHCTTSATTCELSHASFVGNRCSCRVPGGRARGSVTP
ncbi:MAG TPA: hypothetical protein VLZ74_05625 [Methylocella sp.]|nr:hypothetical protein [Methylocella sp.]